MTTNSGGRLPGRAGNPPWTYDELVLALDLYLRRGIVPTTDPELLELSSVLNRLRSQVKVNDETRFRNPNGVHMKLANFRSQDQPGKGLQHGNQLEPEVWNRFHNRRTPLAKEVARIKNGAPRHR